MIYDLRFAVRQLFKSPGFTAAAVIVLALGIGANTAVFSLVHTMFFAPPPYANPQEVVQVFSQDKKSPKTYRGFSYPTYTDIRSQNTVFTDVMAYNLAMIGLGQKGDTRRTFGAIVSSNYFSVLGVPLARGRTFLPEEEALGKNAPVAVVSYAYWQKHNLDPGVLGSELLINGRAFTIVGIAPRGFTGTMQVFSVEVWVPLSNYDRIANDFEQENKTALGDRTGQQLLVVGRLKPGLTAAAAKPSLEGLAANLEKAFPVEQKDQTFTTAPISRFSVSTSPSGDGGMATIAPMLLGMAIVVLLVACLNLANMLLARGTARRKEIAIRLALGGSRSRIVRQLMTEGFVLAVLGGAGGLILGLWSSDLLVMSFGKMMPLDIVWLAGPNLAILSATFAFCVVGTIGFALGPALKLSRTAVVSDLKEQAGEDVVRRRWRFLPRNPLVVVQIAFSLALLTAAALFIRGASKAASVDTGLKPGASFLLETDASLAGYDQKRAHELYRSLEERLAAIPGVEHASISATVPFGVISLGRNVQRAGLTSAPDARPATAAEGLAFNAAWNTVGADYFATVALPVIRGRVFTQAEATQSAGPMVAIIDEVLAKKLWPEGDALGQRIQYASENAPKAKSGSRGVGVTGDLSGETAKETIEIVGIVPATKQQLFEKEPSGQMYVPFARGFQSNVSFFVRFRTLGSGSEASTADLLRRTVREVDPALPVLSLKTFDQHMESNFQLWVVRAGAAMFSVFGILALGLAVVGLYGVKAYAVARRTREIGIRMALGAQRGAVLRMIMGEGSIMLLCGIVLGLLLAAGTGKILSGMLYEVGALDPVAFTLAPLTLAAAALLATWLPARRATRISPMAALRTE
ncbi:MAG TPA: ABC transporter permease [Chthoniobacterales bacterium]|jgi:predicted permease|nr:ABC transporter permease [Chthoniobacterales bacterium]